MDNQLTFKEIWMIFWGFGYLVNHNSKEIHRINDKHRNCHLELISKENREYVTRRRAVRLIKNDGYNGCRWCWSENDMDKIKKSRSS